MIVLFKEGTSHQYKGITCQMQIVNEFGFEPLLEEGWVLNPADLYQEGETSEKKEEPEKTADSKVTTLKPNRLTATSTRPAPLASKK